MIQTVLQIDGMMCGMCESHINDVLRRQFPLRSVTSSHKKGETVLLSDHAPDEAALREAIAQTGYTVTAVYSRAVEEKTGFLSRLRRR